MRAIRVDFYVLDTLMRGLVGHDKKPSAFIVYLFLWQRTLGRGEESVPLSLHDIAEDTGLSKSAVQSALRVLTRRRLLRIEKGARTAVPRYTALRPWADKASGNGGARARGPAARPEP